MELLVLLRRKWYLLVIFPVLFAVAAGAFVWGFLTDDYTSRVSLYVLSKADTSRTATATNSDLSASQQMVNDISVMARSNRVRTLTAQNLGMETLAGYSIGVSSATTNRVISLTVTGKRPESVALVANELAKQTSAVAIDAMDLQSIYVIDEALVPLYPSGPNRPQYVLVALLAGLFVAVALIVLLDMLDGTVRGSEEAEELLDLPVLGRMPFVKDLR